MVKGDWDGAIAEYRTAISQQPNYPLAHMNLGLALRARGDQDGAITEFRLALGKELNTPEGQSALDKMSHANDKTVPETLQAYSSTCQAGKTTTQITQCTISVPAGEAARIQSVAFQGYSDATNKSVQLKISYVGLKGIKFGPETHDLSDTGSRQPTLSYYQGSFRTNGVYLFPAVGAITISWSSAATNPGNNMTASFVIQGQTFSLP